LEARGPEASDLKERDSTADPELLRSAQQGSKAAWEALYERYLPSLWRYVYTQVDGDRHTAADIVSETFLAALHGLHRLDPDGGPLYAWLVGIARHKLGDHRRHVRRWPTNPAGLDLQDLVPGEAINPSEGLEGAENRARVAETMARLSDEERLVLEWKHVDGLSAREIAKRTSRTEKAVRALLYRARKSFRAIFRGQHRPTA